MTPNEEWRDPPSPLRVLVSSGWLSEEDARDPRLRVDAAASSHAVFHVIAPNGRAVVVKQVTREAAAAGRSLRSELFVYRLANWIPALAAALPRAVLIDEKYQLLVLESVGGGNVWLSADGNSSIGSSVLAEQLGRMMAGWHNATQDTGLWMSPAIGILDMPDALDTAAAGRAHATQLLMQSIVDDPAFSSALRAARAGWRDRCLIHGDIRRDNWVLVRPAEISGLKVLDWDLSGSGDPAWDLGSVLAELSLDTIRDQRPDDSPWSPDQEASGRAFFRAYVKHGGLLNARESNEWNHIVLCAVARLLHVACEWAELQPTIEMSPVSAVLAQARLLLENGPDIVSKLMRRSRR